MFFARLQGTPEFEKNSFHGDILEIRQIMDMDDEKEYDVEEFDYYETLDYHVGLDREDLFELVKNTDYEGTLKIANEHPLEGICGISINKDSVEDYEYEDCEIECTPGSAEYVAIYEGEYLCDLGDGDLFKPVRLIKVIEKPKN